MWIVVNLTKKIAHGPFDSEDIAKTYAKENYLSHEIYEVYYYIQFESE